MGIVKFKPYTVMPGVNSLFDDMLSDNFFRKLEQGLSVNVPKVNIAEFGSMYKLEIQAPGFNKEDFKLNIENDLLRINAEHKAENKVEEGKYSRREFSHSSFERSFTLPEGVKTDNIKAAYDKGILSIEIPKVDAKAEKPSVQIKVD